MPKSGRKKVVQTEGDRLEVWAGALTWLDLCFCRIICIAPPENSAEVVVENSIRIGSDREHLTGVIFQSWKCWLGRKSGGFEPDLELEMR